jgi:hypothetical protein
LTAVFEPKDVAPTALAVQLYSNASWRSTIGALQPAAKAETPQAMEST